VTVVAGDADGDGIADCGLQKLPVGEINGVTYYVGFRIIDNNSAINVNTALRRDADYDTNGTVLPAPAFNTVQGMFPASVGLVELLQTRPQRTNATDAQFSGENFNLGTEMNDLNAYRFGLGMGQGSSLQPPQGVVDIAGGGTNTYPLDDQDSPQPFQRFQYFGIGDALWMGLGRRSENPANSLPPNGSAYVKFTPLPPSDTAALAYHFCLVNTNASPTTTELLLNQTTYKWAANKAGRVGSSYDPDKVVAWYNDNFNYEAEQLNPPSGAPGSAPCMSRRAIFVTSNPVSNQMPRHDMRPNLPYGLPQNMKWGLSTFGTQAGTSNNPLFPNYTPTPNTMPDYNANPTVSPPQPEHTTARASVNTADFGTLWRAYWNVMVDQTTDTGQPFTGTPFPVPNGSAATDVWDGMQFSGVSPYTATANTATNGIHPAKDVSVGNR
jgi:hypothetical protein